MASSFEGIDAPTVQIFPREGKGREGDGKGRNGRGIDTFKSWRHFLGVNRNYIIYIIPIYA